MFDGLTAKSKAEPIDAVRTFLDRVAALRNGTDATRTSTRAEDQAAAALLAARRIVDASEEARLRALISEATSLPDVPAPAPRPNLTLMFGSRPRGRWTRGCVIGGRRRACSSRGATIRFGWGSRSGG